MNWPKPNESLFRSDDDWTLNACVNCHRPSLGAVADGYKEGAEALARATSNGDATLDLAILPIVFLYRQYLELKLKELIDTGRRLESEGEGYPPTHDLLKLWNEAQRLLKAHYGNAAPSELNNVRPCINELALHDPESFAFRYPTDKRGNATLRGIVHINLRHLYETMERISDLLDCLASDLAERLSYMYQMQGEHIYGDR